MALYDQRVFRCGEKWWAAQVYGGVGQVRFGEPDPNEPFRAIRENVVFTCLTDRDANSRSNAIPGGRLNRLSHASICHLAEEGRDWGSLYKMYPYNSPNEQAINSPIVQDREGLRWATKRQKITLVTNETSEERPSLELICLDDSALKKEIAFDDENVINEYLAIGAEGKLLTLIDLVKNTYVELNQSTS